jgi:hypothetical protein
MSFDVAPLVTIQLSIPKLSVAGRASGPMAFFMPMPEATMYKHNFPISRENYIRTTW